ncbi:unnamed protein product [Cylicocyclus nassatus]|uniref:DNA2/NAM7 helicase-like C-terminal domain-containing protein n=1 Tax=Cylicocyclus nassatus TaxID=53992 RepID=A0AA36M5U7_CYLNA|nr:unnamed protein product [Cylicocyclus nassatus]
MDFPNPQLPFMFVHVNGTSVQSASHSHYNEGGKKDDMRVSGYYAIRRGVAANNLVIITFYKDQYECLEEFVTRIDANLSTVDTVKGRQEDVVIVLTTKTHFNPEGAEFRGDPRRMNVALTKCRHGQFVLGHRESLEQCRSGRRFWTGREPQRDHTIDKLGPLLAGVNTEIQGRCERRLGERGNEEPVSKPGAEISKNLGRFAERRTDIFGVDAAGAEQTVIGKKLGEEAPQPAKQLIWDGSEETRKAHSCRTKPIHDWADAITSSFCQGADGHTNACTWQWHARTGDHGRTDELEPEAEWLKKVNGAIDLRIQLPVSAEFNMDGSIIGLQIDVSLQVTDLQQQLQDKHSMPTR